MQSYSFCSAMRNFSSDISTFIVMFVCIISGLYSDRCVPFRFSFIWIFVRSILSKNLESLELLRNCRISYSLTPLEIDKKSGPKFGRKILRILLAYTFPLILIYP